MSKTYPKHIRLMIIDISGITQTCMGPKPHHHNNINANEPYLYSSATSWFHQSNKIWHHPGENPGSIFAKWKKIHLSKTVFRQHCVENFHSLLGEHFSPRWMSDISYLERRWLEKRYRFKSNSLFYFVTRTSTLTIRIAQQADSGCILSFNLVCTTKPHDDSQYKPLSYMPPASREDNQPIQKQYVGDRFSNIALSLAPPPLQESNIP